MTNDISAYFIVPANVEAQKTEVSVVEPSSNVEVQKTKVSGGGVSGGHLVQLQLKSTAAKSKYTSASPQCTWTWPWWT